MNPNSLLDAASFSPRALESPSAWVGHIPFAAWVIQEVSPRIFVELGTHFGHSYFSFCQSVAEAHLSTKCYAVDTWLGDKHAGHYSDEIFARVSAHQKEHYSGFSHLLRMTFNEALINFTDNSIDLLHIDGLHTYEAVRHDFENWLPKLAPGAIVMFHDTNVRKEGFGVWKLWEELQVIYPNNLAFEHSYGLGVLQLNDAHEDNKHEWLQPNSPAKQQLVDYFTALGSRDIELHETKTHFKQFIVEHDTQVAALNFEIDRIKSTFSWQITKPLRFAWNKLLNPIWCTLLRPIWNAMLRPLLRTLLRIIGRQPQGTMGRYHPRAIMARHHLSGEGIEIGAMHFPVWRHANMKVKYVDNTSREDSIDKFPELNALDLVNPDYIEDGFTLASLADSSQDFLIANHVLEHAPNPLAVLTSWARVLRLGGNMLLSVPIADTCFDRGRQITSLEHLLADYHADPEELRWRNLDHYLEWISISEPAIFAMNGQPFKEETATERRARAENMCSANSEIHFHTFSVDSFKLLLEFFAHSLDGRFKVIEIRNAGGEVIAVISRCK